jgi:predicted metalloprotease
MRWNPGHQSRHVEDRRGASGRPPGGGLRVGVGGLIVLLVLSVVFKRDFLSLADPGALAVGSARPEAPVASSPAEDSLVQFVSFVLDDAQATWDSLFRADGRPYTPAILVLYRDRTPTACGTGEAASGPFYCPGDQQVYLDLAFFDELHQRFGAAGDFAQAYVVAHEIGHHVQTITGTSQQVRQMQQRAPAQANALSVQLELQADCYAGVWAHATNRRARMEQGDLEEGLRAAAAVGDDRLSSGRAPRESFTHGSSAERARWFRRGFDSGRPDDCDTFNTRR